MRHNIIKRIADYKMAVVGAAPVAVEYTAEGVPATARHPSGGGTPAGRGGRR